MVGKPESENHGEGMEMEEVDDGNLPYCRAVLTESIRMHLRILFTTRVISKDLILDTDDEGGTAILPKGARVFIKPALIHLDERNFEWAEEFAPERWVPEGTMG